MIRDRPKIPLDYGVTKADAFVDWGHVEERFVSERVYWFAVTDEADRPHVRPIDGLYLDDALYVGGRSQTRWISLIRPCARVTVHLDGATSPGIQRGSASQVDSVLVHASNRGQG